jgi:hypothetical protein
MVLARERPLGTQHRLEAYATLARRVIAVGYEKSFIPENRPFPILLAARLLDGLGPSWSRQQADQCLTALVWNQGNFCVGFD